MSKDLAQQKSEEQLWDLHEKGELIPLEFTQENAISISGVDENTQQSALEGLKLTLMERKVLDTEFETVSVLEVNAENIPKFKALRLKYVKNRTQGIDKWHERESETALKYKQFLDAKKRSETAINNEREAKLLEGEKFFENQEKEKARVLNEQRIEKIKPYVTDTSGLNFAEFDDESFDDYLLGKKTRFENEAKAKKEAEELAEKTRLAEIEKQKKIAAENAKLKKEAEAKEAQLKKERAEAEAKQKAIQEQADKKAREEKAKQDAILKAEQEAKAKIEAELKAKKDAEAKAEKERLEKEKAEKLEAEKLAKAPIKKQLSVWVDGFTISENPLLENEVSISISEKFEAFKKWAKLEIEKL